MSNYKDQLDALKRSFSSAVETFHNTYIIHHTNPESAEYSQIYGNEKGQINTINNSLFNLDTTVQQSIDTLNLQISALDKKLEKEKDSNDILHKKLDEKQGKEFGSEELILETQEMYDYQRIKNISLFIGDIVLLYFIYKLAEK